MKLKDLLRSELSTGELDAFVGSFDIVGDIAIIIIPPELQSKEEIIGNGILKIHKHIKVVAKRDGFYEGEFRTIPLKIIAGEDRKETQYTEHGVRFFLNPEKVYLSVRSGNERKRLASLVKADEEVLILFSGIGVFPLVISKLSMAREIVGIEKNPIAHQYATKSLAKNKKIKNVTLLEGDVIDVLPKIDRKFDRVAMPLPKASEEFLDIALNSLKNNGWLHYYEFQYADSFDESVEKIKTACARNKRKMIDSRTTACGHSGPRTYRICVDALIE